MEHKLFFIFTLSAVMVGVAFLMALSLNLLPTNVTSFVYNYFSIGSQNSQYPYLTKFEGHWSTTFAPEVAQTQIAKCEAYSGTITVQDGKVTGVLGALNRSVTVVASVDEKGNLSGRLARGEGSGGVITGILVKADGSGMYNDSSDCHGTYTMKKVELVRDPKQGNVVSYTGDVMLGRGGKERFPEPGEPLYAGDVVSVPQGGNAYLSIGAEGITVKAGTTYTVVEASHFQPLQK